MFVLDPVLEKDTITLCDLSLCRVLLMNDSQYPWFILVPMKADVREVIDLTEVEQQLLWVESAKLNQMLRELYSPHKLNIAALGNMVPQLHVHHIARFTDDAAWPKPVWGINPPKPYNDETIADIKTKVLACLHK